MKIGKLSWQAWCMVALRVWTHCTRLTIWKIDHGWWVSVDSWHFDSHESAPNGFLWFNNAPEGELDQAVIRIQVRHLSTTSDSLPGVYRLISENRMSRQPGSFFLLWNAQAAQNQMVREVGNHFDCEHWKSKALSTVNRTDVNSLKVKQDNNLQVNQKFPFFTKWETINLYLFNASSLAISNHK